MLAAFLSVRLGALIALLLAAPGVASAGGRPRLHATPPGGTLAGAVTVLIVILVVLNVVSFALFGIDKAKARRTRMEDLRGDADHLGADLRDGRRLGRRLGLPPQVVEAFVIAFVVLF